MPNVVDVAAIEPVSSPARRAPRAVRGELQPTSPTATGLRFLLEQVFPRVWAELPDARLALVGGGLESRTERGPACRGLGFVEDLAGAYAHASCVVVPLLQGGGTPLKLIEALAYGLPVIATPRAAAGLDVRDGEHCLHRRRRAREFAAALVRVLARAPPSSGART